MESKEYIKCFHIQTQPELENYTELKDDRMENYGAYIGFISK